MPSLEPDTDTPPAPVSISPSPHRTDTGNAIRLIRLHGKDLRYIVRLREWFVWNSTRWEPDTSGEVMRRAKDTVRSIYREAAACNDAIERQALASFASRCESSSRIESMIKLAWSEPGIAIQPGMMDADPWLFNVPNGTIDLRTGRLRPHRREDYITKMGGCEYQEGVASGIWDKFIDRIMHKDVGLIAYLRRCIGYSMTGSVREQKLFMPHGGGANGKSTALNAIREVMGDYATPAARDLLLVKPNDNHPTAIADLDGVRMVLGSETDEGRRLAESLVKQLTGGDAMKARKMHKDYYFYSPIFKLWLAVNHLPLVRGTDYAIWRRIQRIPFTVTIPESEQDKDLPIKLRDEFSGILNWCLQGCREWQEQGIDTPTTVTVATDEYRADMDIIGSFIESMCMNGDASATCSKRHFYEAYKTWSEESGEEAMSQRLVSYKLTERGISSNRSKSVHYWVGIKLKG